MDKIVRNYQLTEEEFERLVEILNLSYHLPDARHLLAKLFIQHDPTVPLPPLCQHQVKDFTKGVAWSSSPQLKKP